MANQMIALGVNPVQTPNMLAQAADVLAVGDLMQQQQGRRGVQQAISGGMSPSDPRLLQYGTQGREAYSTAVAGEKAQLENADRRVKMIGGAAGYLRNNPTPDSFGRSIQTLLSNGVISPEEAQAAAAEVGNDPVKIKAYADRVFTQAIDAEAQLMRTYSQDVGGAQQVVGVDPVSGQVKTLSRTAKTLTPGQALDQQQLAQTQQGQARLNALLEGVDPTDPTQVSNALAQSRMLAAQGLVPTSSVEQLQQLVAPKGTGQQTAAIQEYNLATSQGYADTFENWQRDSASLRNWSQPIELARPNPETGETEIGLFSFNSVTNQLKPIGQTPLVGTAQVGELQPTTEAAPMGVAEEAPAAAPPPAVPFTKAPTVAERTATRKADVAKKNVDEITNKIAEKYAELNKLGGVPSTQRGMLSNIQAYGAAVVPQAGRALGTQEQSLRDSIGQIRPLLMQAIKDATGMSAQQMNSNVELQLYLNSATSPDISLEANMAALNNLSNLYGLGTTFSFDNKGNLKTSSQDDDIFNQADQIIRGGR
jgi:hypothetical protein